MGNLEILDLNHVTVIVEDFERARQFYCGVLGMEQVQLPPAFTHATQWFRRGNAEVHMVQVNDSSQEPGDKPLHMSGDRDQSRARHFAFAVADIEGTRQHLEEHGVEIVLGPRPRGDGAYQLFCYDPDGYLVELHTLP